MLHMLNPPLLADITGYVIVISPRTPSSSTLAAFGEVKESIVVSERPRHHIHKLSAATPIATSENILVSLCESV